MASLKFKIVACCLCLLTAFVTAQGQTDKGNTDFFKKTGNLIDSLTRKKVDPLYVVRPKYPWRVIVQQRTDQSTLHMKSRYDGSNFFEGVVGDITVEPRISTAVSTSVGTWIGYRGWGIGYSVNVAGDKGDDWNIESSSGFYYVKLRLHQFKGSEFEARLKGNLADPEDPTAKPEPFDFMQPMYLSSPVKIKTQLLEGVYIFQHRRFSYSAAFNQSYIQKRSAGSPIAGIRLFHSDYDYTHDSNADLIFNMNDIGRINSWQISIGGGYAYNWVPVKNLLINIMAMPILTVYNHIKTYSYDSNYRQMALDDVVHSDDELPREDYRISLMGTDSRTSRITLNINSRASVTYNWPRLYISANGNFYHSRYSYKKNSGRLDDWSVNAKVGVRF